MRQRKDYEGWRAVRGNGQDGAEGRHSAEDRPYRLKKLRFKAVRFRWGGLRQRWT